jgi:long-subunit acyl-CoA synthetase (AMP-forming)
MSELEETFGAPVLEANGMTEAAHQMCCNPLPPYPRKPGSVGIATGSEVAVMDQEDRLLGPGEVGEVVIRGPNVTPGYAANPDANAKAFADGWFRTGDQGHIDADGYLFLRDGLRKSSIPAERRSPPARLTRS